MYFLDSVQIFINWTSRLKQERDRNTWHAHVFYSRNFNSFLLNMSCWRASSFLETNIELAVRCIAMHGDILAFTLRPLLAFSW